jgi:hypothetical protein
VESSKGVVQAEGTEHAKTPDRGATMHASERPSATYILPTVAWASLLEIIARDAPSGAVIEVHTPDMQVLALQTLLALDRQDVQVRLTSRRSGMNDEARSHA